MITKKSFSSSKHAAGLFNKLQYYLTNATMCQSAKQNMRLKLLMKTPCVKKLGNWLSSLIKGKYLDHTGVHYVPEYILPYTSHLYDDMYCSPYIFRIFLCTLGQMYHYHTLYSKSQQKTVIVRNTYENSFCSHITLNNAQNM